MYINSLSQLSYLQFKNISKIHQTQPLNISFFLFAFLYIFNINILHRNCVIAMKIPPSWSIRVSSCVRRSDVISVCNYCHVSDTRRKMLSQGTLRRVWKKEYLSHSPEWANCLRNVSQSAAVNGGSPHFSTLYMPSSVHVCHHYHHVRTHYYYYCYQQPAPAPQ